MKTALPILSIFFLCNLSAQKNCQTCWGQNDTVPTLTKQDKQALRLYSPLKWYDFSTYKFKGGGKRAVWIAAAVTGILHGAGEAYHAEPGVLQKRFGGADDSWIGPMQWKRQYFGRDPNLPHKPEIWNSFRDYWHFQNLAKYTLCIGGGFVIGHTNQPLKYKLIDLAIGSVITTLTASGTYTLLR